MLRVVVLVLLLLNGAYLAWSQGWLSGLGYGPAQQREPQRMGQQIRPEALELLPSEKIKRPEVTVPAESALPDVPADPASGR